MRARSHPHCAPHPNDALHQKLIGLAAGALLGLLTATMIRGVQWSVGHATLEPDGLAQPLSQAQH